MSTLNGGPGNIVTNGLVLYLDAANYLSYVSGSTTWRDISSSNLSGSLINGPTFSSGNGGSIVFDGTNDYVDCGNTINLTSAISIVTWIRKTTKTPRNIYEGVVDKGRDNYGAWSLNVDEVPLRVTFKCKIAGVNRSIITTSDFSDNTWMQVAGTFNGSTLAIYQNSILNNSASYAGSIGTNSESIRIGAANDGYYFLGNIASTQIYNRALTSDEILQNYNSTKARFGL
jgi:hypothetical protein